MSVLKKYSLLEVVMALAVILICARYIWARELLELENQVLANLGLPIYSKYLLTIPLAILFIYGIYERESIKAKIKGAPVVRASVIVVAIALLSVAVLLLLHSVANNA